MKKLFLGQVIAIVATIAIFCVRPFLSTAGETVFFGMAVFSIACRFIFNGLAVLVYASIVSEMVFNLIVDIFRQDILSAVIYAFLIAIMSSVMLKSAKDYSQINKISALKLYGLIMLQVATIAGLMIFILWLVLRLA